MKRAYNFISARFICNTSLHHVSCQYADERNEIVSINSLCKKLWCIWCQYNFQPIYYSWTTVRKVNLKLIAVEIYITEKVRKFHYIKIFQRNRANKGWPAPLQCHEPSSCSPEGPLKLSAKSPLNPCVSWIWKALGITFFYKVWSFRSSSKA